MSSKESNPSFCKGLFAGQILENEIFPYPELKQEDAEILGMTIDALQKFASEEVDSVAIDKNHKIPPELIRGLGDLGIFGLIIPQDCEGLGLSQTAYGRVFEELGATDASIAVMIGAHSSIGLKGILLFGTDEQKKKYLPALASGHQLAAFALTEPGAGSDAYSIQTKAIPQSDGTYLLNGNKIWITNGGLAHVFTVFAKTPSTDANDHKERVTAFIVTRDMEGVSTGAEEHKLGIRGSSTTQVFFSNVRVPKENVLGQVGKGFKIAMEVLNSGRLGLATGCVGGAKQMLKLAVTHATERKQFGKKLSEFGMIQQKLGQMAVEIYAIESAAYLTCGMVDQNVEDYSIESAICKFAASEMLWQVANETMQIAGGTSYMEEYPYERMLRDARINMIFEGTNEILRSFVALSGMRGVADYLKTVGKALNDPIKSLGVLYDYAITHIPMTRGFYGDKITKAHAELKTEASMLEENVIQFSQAVERAVMKHREKIWEKQFVQKRIAEMAKDLYLVSACISRASTKLNHNAKDKDDCLDMTRIFCKQAHRRIHEHLKDMDRNLDEPIKELAHRVADHGGYTVES